MGCSELVLRCFQGIFLFYLSIAGIGLAIYGGVSSYLILISNSDLVIKDYGTLVPSALTFILGVMLLIFVILGCCGVCRESTCCMETYSAFLILLGLAHLALGAYCIIVYKNNIQLGLRFQMEHDLQGKLGEAEMDDIQDWMSCCGLRDPLEEYKYVDADKLHGNELPNSCCESSVPCRNSAADRYLDGCLESVYDFTIGTNIIIGYISLGVGAAELLAAILGLCLSCGVWRNQSVAVWR
ncbi:hypothetical protein JTB14_027450 [Gonioctena quinquepunctata]|nr:hypothetical protein JTB14_027450 [Gonioctena quinquepunctata]